MGRDEGADVAERLGELAATIYQPLIDAELALPGNVRTEVPKATEMVAAGIRTIFAEPDAEHGHAQVDVIVGMLGRQLPRRDHAARRRR